MKKQFVPFELALKLKELGFNEECLGYYNKEKLLRVAGQEHVGKNSEEIMNDILNSKYCSAALWQQAFDWFEERHQLFSSLDKCDNSRAYYFDFTIIDSKNRDYSDEMMIDSAKRQLDMVEYNTKEEARQACLEKLIEIVEQKK